jgi:hypothetical protein
VSTIDELVDEAMGDRCENRIDVVRHQPGAKRGEHQRAIARMLPPGHALQRAPHHGLAMQSVGGFRGQRRFVGEGALDVVIGGQEVGRASVERYERNRMFAAQAREFVVEAGHVECEVVFAAQLRTRRCRIHDWCPQTVTHRAR